MAVAPEVETHGFHGLGQMRIFRLRLGGTCAKLGFFLRFYVHCWGGQLLKLRPVFGSFPSVWQDFSPINAQPLHV